jgi:hypothetical protein
MLPEVDFHFRNQQRMPKSTLTTVNNDHDRPKVEIYQRIQLPL